MGVGLRARVLELVTRLDHLRGSPARLGGPGEHKEWQHFLVHAPGLQLLINFNVVDDAWTPGAGEVARMILLARVDRWRGAAERFPAAACDLAPGRVDLSLGRNQLRFAGGRYHLDVALRDGSLAARLELEPVTLPLISHNQPLTRTRRLSWLFMPRLRARGWVRVGDRRFELARALAYHDHNWGRFRWGDDFTWEWASALPDDPACPWSLVFWRLTDRARARARAQGLFLWRGALHRRSFLDRELAVETAGLLPVDERGLVIPPVMRLLTTPGASDIPGRVTLTAQADGDALELEFTPHELARVAIPSETAPEETTLLHEVGGRARARGRVGGELVELEGPGVFEFIRH
ncbi:MAG: hypothetical protein H6713_38470 [Myxococcales bacterium]|nr:hypothetical protein [Myxococcales bacterium]